MLTQDEIIDEIQIMEHSLARLRKHLADCGKHWHKDPYRAYAYAHAQSITNNVWFNQGELREKLLALSREMKEESDEI